MTPLAEVLSHSRERGRAAFVAFLSAGDPNLRATAEFLRVLAEAGADIIELGIPFSDPVADGPAIQASSQRALRSGTTLLKALSLLRRLRRSGFLTPVILFGYLNPVLALGRERFAGLCAASGVQGVLVVDLPAEESGPLAAALRRRGVETVLLASPTTSEKRLRAIGRASGSIVYYVSREGVTGVKRGLAPGLSRRLRRVRTLCGKPLIVGFGVATPAQARALARDAEGVVVGSALVSEIAKAASPRAARLALGRKARAIAVGLRRDGRLNGF